MKTMWRALVRRGALGGRFVTVCAGEEGGGSGGDGAAGGGGVADAAAAAFTGVWRARYQVSPI